MCAYVFVDVHKYVSMSMHGGYMCTFVSDYVYICEYEHMCIRMQACICISMSMYLVVFICLCACIHMCRYMGTYAHV